MARIVINSTLPLRAAATYAAGRHLVTPATESVLASGTALITWSQLPESAFPSDEAFNQALRRAVRHLDLQIDPGALRPILLELLSLPPVDRDRMCAESHSLAALWTTFAAELPVPKPACTPLELPLLAVGYLALGDLDLSTLNSAALDDSVIILPPRDIQAVQSTVNALKSLGWTVWDELPPTDPDVGERLATDFVMGLCTDRTGLTVEAASDIHQECKAALNALHALPGTQMLIVPDLTIYGPALEAVAFDLDVALDLPLERTLASTRLGAWLAELFNVLGGDWRAPAVRRVLGHPLASDVTPALLQATSRARAAQQAAWLALGLPGWLRAWPQEATYEQFADLTVDVLNSIDPQRLTHDDHRAGQQLMDEVDNLVTQTHAVSLCTFAEQIRQLLQDALPPQAGNGLPVRTPATAVGRFDHVAILGLSEGLLPAPPIHPPMLDFYDRWRLHEEGVQCRTALDAVQERDLAFWHALSTAQQSLRLSWPQRLGKRQQQPSVYLSRLNLTGPDLTSVPQIHAASTGLPHLDATEPGRIGTSFPLDQHTFSATQLTRFSQCPYRWYAQHALGLNSPEESRAHLLPQERGRFNHRVLELVGRPAKHQPQPREVMLSHFPDAFDQAETEQGFTRRPTWSQQRPELRRRLQRTLSAPEFIQDGATVLDVERAFDLHWNGLRITGKIDRVDRVGDELLITDYKSGSSPQAGPRRSREVQMNVYLDVAAALYPDLRVSAGQYLSLGNTERRVLGRVERVDAALDELISELREAAETGYFPVRPGAYCETCPLPALCRHSEVPGGDA